MNAPLPNLAVAADPRFAGPGHHPLHQSRYLVTEGTRLIALEPPKVCEDCGHSEEAHYPSVKAVRELTSSGNPCSCETFKPTVDLGALQAVPVSLENNSGAVIATMTDHERQAEYARLFAAAPQMLQAIKRFLKLGKDGVDTSWQSKDIQPALYELMVAAGEAEGNPMNTQPKKEAK